MTRWHFAILSTSLFVISAVFFWVGLGLVSVPLIFIAWGVMVISAWEPMSELNTSLEVPKMAELEPISVTSSE